MNRQLRNAIKALAAPALALTADPLLAGVVLGLALASALRRDEVRQRVKPEARNRAREARAPIRREPP